MGDPSDLRYLLWLVAKLGNPDLPQRVRAKAVRPSLERLASWRRELGVSCPALVSANE